MPATVPHMVSLPLWAVFAVSFGSPVLAFAGVLLAQLLGRKSARELETRSKREETMRNLRWAAELAVDEDPARAGLGVAQLVALADSLLLDEDQQLFVEAALRAVIDDAVEDVVAAGPEVEVVRTWEPLLLEGRGTDDLHSSSQDEPGGATHG